MSAVTTGRRRVTRVVKTVGGKRPVKILLPILLTLGGLAFVVRRLNN